MERAILVRHGESQFSVRGLVSGDPSATGGGLTERGREQARELARQLAGERIDLCVTSEFVRTHESADLALAGRPVPRLVLAELNDIRLGEYEGRPLDEYRTWARSHGPDELCPGGGESRAGAAARYARAFRAILERPEERILVVAHSLPIRYALTALDGRAPRAIVGLVEYAEPHRLSRAQLERAVGRLEAWCASPAFS